MDRASDSDSEGRWFDSSRVRHVVTDFVSFVTAFLLKKPSLTHAVVPPFRNRSRSSRLFGCKRPHDGSLSLPIFADSRTGASPVPTVVRNYRFAFLRLAKDCKGSNPLLKITQRKTRHSKRYTLFSWRRARDSNPRNRFGGLHDFQSCSFDQLGQLSVLPVILYTIV